MQLWKWQRNAEPVNAGKLINRFRIPANMALDILAKMQEEGIITEKGVVAKKKGIVWKEK